MGGAGEGEKPFYKRVFFFPRKLSSFFSFSFSKEGGTVEECFAVRP